MDMDHLNYELKKLHTEYQLNVRRLKLKYAEANNSVRIGDIVRDHIGRIKVESMSLYESQGKPEYIYTGTQVKANGEPYKNGEKRNAYQTNLVAHNTETISTDDCTDRSRDV